MHVGFRLCKKSDMGIINLQNIQISIKSSVNEGEDTIILWEGSYTHCIYLFLK